MLCQLLPETSHHTQRLKIKPETFLGELLVHSVLKLPEILHCHAERLLHTFLQQQVDKCIIIALETHQSLSYLITVKHELIVHEVLYSLHSVVPNLLVWYSWIKDKQSLSRF